jgi:hypothetical protein
VKLGDNVRILIKEDVHTFKVSEGYLALLTKINKNEILSRIGDSEPGKLDKEFYLRIISVGALPVLAVLGSQFPQIGRFLFSWIQPAIEALH